MQLTPDTDVAAAVHAACERLGKPVPEAAVQALVDNWYTTAGELAALPDETARSLGLPLRLKAVVGELLAQPDVAAEASSLGSVQAGGGSSAAVALSTPRSSSASSSGDEAEVQLSDSEADGRLAEALEAMRGSGGEADAAAAAAWDQAHLPVEQRRCPPIRRAGFSRADLPKIVKRSRPRKYALSVSWRHASRLGPMQDVVQQCAGQVCSSQAIHGTQPHSCTPVHWLLCRRVSSRRRCGPSWRRCTASSPCASLERSKIPSPM